MSPRNPLEMPEVASVVASYLKGDDLARCVCVSRSWQALFLSYRWRVVRAGFRRRSWNPLDTACHQFGPDPTYIYQHRDYIHDLSLCRVLAGLDKHRYTNLQKLTIDFMSAFNNTEQEILLEVNEMFPRLTELTLNSVKVEGTSWTKLLEHSHIAKLWLTSTEIKAIDTPTFWKVCSKLETLVLRSITIEGTWIPVDWTFSHLRQLTVDHVQPVNRENQVRWILQCPVLRELEWSCHALYRPPVLLRDPIPTNHWTHLSELDIDHSLHDTDLTFILDGVGNLVTLRLSSHGLSKRSLQALTRHFPTLVKLDIEDETEGSPSLVLRDALCSCPRLEYLRGGDVLVRDVIEGGPWICQHLRELHICFLFAESELDLQPKVFERLSTLVQLEHLYMVIPDHHVNGEERLSVLEFRLENGLGQLANLHRIAWVYFEGSLFGGDDAYIPQLGKDEIAWILQHWKRLAYFNGTFNSDPQLNKALVDMLETAGIFG
ncbi:hypothetical protein B0O80DRAFT_449793 [Mortierella sp. GBAus27b]|nr:hypothetical protein B0O80DRAFT_449793 [Mortierella sp. GBAus27b]